MRLSSPIASTFSSQASRSLLFGLCGLASVGASRCVASPSAAPTFTLISMTVSPRHTLVRLSFDHQLGMIVDCPPRPSANVTRPAHIRVHLAQRALHDRQILFRHARAQNVLQVERGGNEPVDDGPSPCAERDDDLTAVRARAAAGDETHADEPRHQTRQGRGVDAGEPGEIDLALASVVGEHRKDSPHGDAQPVRGKPVLREAGRQGGTYPIDQVRKVIVQMQVRTTHNGPTKSRPSFVYGSAADLSKSGRVDAGLAPLCCNAETDSCIYNNCIRI